MCLDESVTCVACAGIEEGRDKSVKTLLNLSLKQGVEALANLVKQRLQDKGCVPSFISVHLSVTRSGFVAGEFTPCIKAYVEKENFTRDRLELLDKVQRAFACHKFGPSRRMRKSFVLIAGDGRDGSVLWVAKLLLLPCPNS